MAFKKSKKKEAEFNEAKMNGVTLRLYESGAASLNFEVAGGNLIVKGWVKESKNGYFFAFPSHKYKDEYYNDVYTMGDDLRNTIVMLVAELTEE